ncbi:tetratricopeptide repeat protein [Flavobacterium artemisiae]|uniref:Tetratricopeptide repeat protein n=1 Tax=Flavobacterium artemisiae TaxID=2126556 RepID=A0ABW4HFW9_9FLAO
MTADTKEINNKGVKHFLNNDFEKAKNSYFEVLTIDSNNAVTLNNLGLLYLQEEKFKEAENSFLQAYNQSQNPTYALNLGHSLVYQNRYDEAENYYKISLRKDDIMAWKSLIALYEFTNQIDKAIETLSKVIVQISIDVSFKIQLAKNYIRKEFYQEALDILQLASLQEDLEHEVWYYTAYIHFKNKNFNLAQKAIETSLEFHNSWENALELAGTISMTLNNLEQAIAYWNEALQQNPKNNAVRVNKAVVLLGSKREKEAVSDFKFVLKNDSSNLKAIYYLGGIYISKYETKQKGIELLERLIKTENPYTAKAKELLIQI